MVNNICIGRQFGTGGREIGAKLAKELGYSFYDRELLEIAAERSGIQTGLLEAADENSPSPFLYAAFYEDKNGFGGISANNALFNLQSEIILEKAKTENCVFIGRCADYVLRLANIPTTKIFINAPFENRIARRIQNAGLTEKEALIQVRREDKRRKAYYNFYVGDGWGKPESYDICVNTAKYGIDGTVALLKKILA